MSMTAVSNSCHLQHQGFERARLQPRRTGILESKGFRPVPDHRFPFEDD